MKILIVDDNADNRSLLERALLNQGYFVSSATNGARALERALDSPPDLIVSDIMMPEMDGFELCRRVKTDDRLRHIAFIFYSATFVEGKDEQLALSLGASRFLIKPLAPRDFLDVVREVIDEYQAHRLSVPDRPLGQTELLDRMHVEALTRKLEKKVSELEAERDALRNSEAKNIIYQEQLRSMASEISFVEERERHKIATALHDQIGQSLAMAGIKLAALRNAIPDNLAGQFDEIGDMINLTIQHSRTLTFEISPPILYDMGLEAAVCSLAERYQKEHNIRLDCSDDRLLKPLSDEMRILLFQGVRELIVNAVKHAQPGRITISCQREGSEIKVIVQDDGVGFAPADAETLTGKGFGLFSLRERLKYLGGSIAITSAPGRGTKVTLTAPLALEPTEKGDEA